MVSDWVTSVIGIVNCNINNLRLTDKGDCIGHPWFDYDKLVMSDYVSLYIELKILIDYDRYFPCSFISPFQLSKLKKKIVAVVSFG